MNGIRNSKYSNGMNTRISRKLFSSSSGPRHVKNKENNGHDQRPIFVAATKQHVGKTSTSLALLSGLQKRFDKVGFIKPVGQQHVTVYSKLLGKEIKVDKDVCLMRERFHLDHIDYEHMSPVIIPQGYTKKYIEGQITHGDQLDKILQSYKHVSEASDVTLMEGTGHCAVGSIVGVNNAQVAAMLGADVVLVANGGLGSAFDELELNRVICQHYGVNIAGVVINKVLPEKYQQTKHYMSKVLQDTWGVPLLGCIPDRPFLGCPALMDLETIFGTKLINGEKHRFRHYNMTDINLVTTSLTRFLENLRNKPSRTLYVCHVTRDDLILGFMAEYQRRTSMKSQQEGSMFEAALLVCGRGGKYELSEEVKDMIMGMDGAPVLLVEYSTHQAMQKIHAYTPKFNIDDEHRVNTAVEHYEPFINFDELLARTKRTD
eukprot:CAMPEP_0176497098 /NCGR_PEP_ID=MMETSP0200_2-20121128/11539_1 /TAXON_ID=947934 /ORGANISM="Chaetoceros sp., Strain GSL56" /LENGTH=430 /DNA_ID=CAMNT_0017895081 /DNA_START=27 /DNA_END=1319 /DNA_ORIENTATION=-